MKESKYEFGEVKLDSKGAALEVVHDGLSYKFELALFSDGEIAVRCQTRNHFEYMTDLENLDCIRNNELTSVYNEPLMLHDKMALFLDDTMLRGRLSILITAIEDNRAEKTIAYKYRWSPYQQRKFQESEGIA